MQNLNTKSHHSLAQQHHPSAVHRVASSFVPVSVLQKFIFCIAEFHPLHCRLSSFALQTFILCIADFHPLHCRLSSFALQNFIRDDCGPVHIIIGDGGNIEGVCKPLLCCMFGIEAHASVLWHLASTTDRRCCLVTETHIVLLAFLAQFSFVVAPQSIYSLVFCGLHVHVSHARLMQHVFLRSCTG